MARGTACAVHNHYALAPQEKHHIWPLGYHGPDTRANEVVVCANGHGDIHYLLDAWLKGKPVSLREYGPRVRELAKRGYDAVMAYGETMSNPKEGWVK